MRSALFVYRNEKLHCRQSSLLDHSQPQLVLGFGNRQILEQDAVFEQLQTRFPSAHIALCTTAGEIVDNEVYDDSISIIALEFDSTTIQPVCVNINAYTDSYEAGKALIAGLDFEALSYIMILSDGGLVNGSELVRGINEVVQNRVPVTGGLAGDGTAFNTTLVGLNQKPDKGNIVAIPFYGNRLMVSHGSMGGWEIFGPERLVTRSDANELFEIEGRNALDLYKTYLGPYANELPGSALLFPLAVRTSDADDTLVVRTILSIDAEKGSMIFAGDIPNGSRVRFMKGHFDKLIDAATSAAGQAYQAMPEKAPALALLISCVGRKIILGKRIEEEVEAVKETFGPDTIITGFYSYGEISPFNETVNCALHNQTMTITTFDER